MRPLHEAFYPTHDGLDAKNAMAEERRSLMKFVAIAMYALVPDNIAIVFAGEC